MRTTWNLFSNKTKPLTFLLSLTLGILFASPLQAMTCSEFNAIGKQANSLGQYMGLPATNHQIIKFKKVIANHASTMSVLGRFTARGKALMHVIKINYLVFVIRDSLALTRSECFIKPNEPMKKVAIKEFNYLLDAIAKKL